MRKWKAPTKIESRGRGTALTPSRRRGPHRCSARHRPKTKMQPSTSRSPAKPEASSWRRTQRPQRCGRARRPRQRTPESSRRRIEEVRANLRDGAVGPLLSARSPGAARGHACHDVQQWPGHVRPWRQLEGLQQQVHLHQRAKKRSSVEERSKLEPKRLYRPVSTLVLSTTQTPSGR